MTLHQCGEACKTSQTAEPNPPLLKQTKTWLKTWMSELFQRQKIRKAPGPNSISSSCLKVCGSNFTKSSTKAWSSVKSPLVHILILIPKNLSITGLNDYKHVTLMSVVIKTFEWLVLAQLKKITGHLIEPLQFAYQANRSPDDAVSMGLHYILRYHDCPGSYLWTPAWHSKQLFSFQKSSPPISPSLMFPPPSVSGTPAFC